jgi:hypothetical protein
MGVGVGVLASTSVVHGGLLLHRRWSSGGVGACLCAQIKEAVLGFFSRQDKDLLDSCSH